jgi:hypothetical protein
MVKAWKQSTQGTGLPAGGREKGGVNSWPDGQDDADGNAKIKDMEEVLFIQDTTDFDLEKHRGRIGDKTGLGVIGNGNNNLGFLCYPAIAVNPADKSLMDWRIFIAPQALSTFAFTMKRATALGGFTLAFT